MRPPRGRGRLQRGVIILPSAFTLGNLFFGVYAIVAAWNGDLASAGWYVVFAASLDLLDGRIARFTRTGSTFGAELDSLVDAISFGVAPGLILFQGFLSATDWSWLLAFVYITAVVVRLARYNLEQPGGAQRQFHGLPSPTAGMILATYAPFSETAFYAEHLAALPWPRIMAITTILLAVLMVSHVPYAKVPTLSFSTAGRAIRAIAFLGLVVLALAFPRHAIFPGLVIYAAFGLTRSVVLGLLERLPDRDPLLDEDDSGADEREVRAVDYSQLAPGTRPARRTKREPRRSGEDARGDSAKDLPDTPENP